MSDEAQYLREHCTCGVTSLDPHDHAAPCPLALVEEAVVFEGSDVIAAMEADFGEIEEPEVYSVTEWTPLELMDSLEAAEEALRALGELLRARTDEGRRLHSERGAIVVELRRRNLR